MNQETYKGTGDPALDIVAAVMRQAIKDARKGDNDAAWFLDGVLPEWREIAGGKGAGSARKREKGAKVG